MKQKKQTVFVIIILAIFILVTSIYFSSMFSEFQRGKNEAQTTFSLITRETSDAIKKNSTDRKALENSFINCIKSYSSIASISLKSNNRIVFSYPASEKNSDNSAKQIPFSITKTTELYDNSNGIYSLTVTLYLLNPSSIYRKGIIAFCCIIAGVIICFIYLSFGTFKNSNNPQNAEKETIKNFETKVEKDLDNIDLDISLDKPAETADNGSKKEEDLTVSSSPMTSFNWESKLSERLSFLTKKAEEDQMELSLFIVRIPFINWQNPQVNAMKSLIRETFKCEENIFTYKEDGFAALMPEMNIDKAIYLADALQIAIMSILAKSGLDFSIGIGISSVSSRIISSERLLSEADQAVYHALEDKSTPVVAFRVNAQKYREFIAQSSN